MPIVIEVEARIRYRPEAVEYLGWEDEARYPVYQKRPSIVQPNTRRLALKMPVEDWAREAERRRKELKDSMLEALGKAVSRSVEVDVKMLEVQLERRDREIKEF